MKYIEMSLDELDCIKDRDIIYAEFINNKVYTPEFYIKSEEDGDKRRVWISTMKLGDNWLYQEPLLIDAYKPTVLSSVPTNMGFLSTLETSSIVSIANTETYCRGGNGISTYDKYLTGDNTVK